MAHSYCKLWIHAIWSTKNRVSLIDEKLENELYSLLKDEFNNTGCNLSIVNGTDDHIHCLFGLNPNKSVAEVIRIVKGASSHFINHYDLTEEKFSWQRGYAAFSVSESMFKKVYYYIQNQKEYHKNKTLAEEEEGLLRLNKLIE